MVLLLALACAPPTRDAYAVGVANLVGRTLTDATHRALEGSDDLTRTWEEAMTVDGPVESAPGLQSLFEPWVGAFDLRLAPRADIPRMFDLAIAGEDVRVRRFDDRGCWDGSCDAPDESLHGGCAIDWDPDDFTYSLSLAGVVDVLRAPPPEREDYPPGDDGHWAWMDDGGAVYEAAFVLGAAGEVDGAPVRVLAHYRERTYSGELAVQVSVDGQHAPEIVCGYSD